MSVEELNDKFKQWNPMENDYKNAKFNHYVSGPGADLDAELQPGQQALQKSNSNKTEQKQNQPFPSLVFKKLPKDMTKTAMHNICSRYGQVKSVRDSTKNDHYFVDLATVADMEAVFRALEKNNYGFQVLVGKNKNPSDKEKNRNNQHVPPVPPQSTGIDYQSRNYRTSSKQHPRPKVQQESLLNIKSADNTGLPLELLVDDAHSLERQGLYKMSNNKNFNYSNGRSYVTMPDKTKEFIDKKHKESSGVYNKDANKYMHTPPGNLMPENMSKCSGCYYACDTVCNRCSQYYCSVDCQLKDWPQHRYICGKPKHLQKIPPSSKETQSADTTSKNLTEDSQNNADTTTYIPIEEKSKKSSSKKNTPKQLRSSSTSSENKNKNSQATDEKANKINMSRSSTSSENNNKNSRATDENVNKTNVLRSPTSSANNKNISRATEENVNKANMSRSSTSSANNNKNSRVTDENVSKPNEETNKENNEEINTENMPRSGSIVTITAIIKTNLVFIRSKTYEADLSYFNTIDTLQALGKMLHPLKTVPKSGSVVIAKFQNKFNRALVLKFVSTEQILVHFMDYGNIEDRKLEELYEAPEEFVGKPRHAIPVLLKDVQNCYMTQEIRKFMFTYLNNINMEVRYKAEDFLEENSIFSVELIDETTQQNLNKMIVKLSTPTEPKSTNEICQRGYLEKKLLPSGDDVEFFVMDNSLMCSGCVSCTTKPYVLEIQKFQQELQTYAESIPTEAYTPRVEELCIVRYNVDGLWYRGVCLEAVGDGHPTIHFIDYGNISIVPIENIRRYPRQFTFPIYTADCEIKGLPQECDDKLVAKLEQLIPNGSYIKCEHVTVFEEDNFYIISLPNVIRELSSCGLIKTDEHVM